MCGVDSLRLSKTIEDHRGLGIKIYGLEAKSQNFSSVDPIGYYFQLGTCLGASEAHVLLSFQDMSLAKNSNEVFLPGGATNSQNSLYISVWSLD